jgi:hypothetical protein
MAELERSGKLYLVLRNKADLDQKLPDAFLTAKNSRGFSLKGSAWIGWSRSCADIEVRGSGRNEELVYSRTAGCCA